MHAGVIDSNLYDKEELQQSQVQSIGMNRKKKYCSEEVLKRKAHLLFLGLELIGFGALVGFEPSDFVVDRVFDRLFVLFADLGAQLLLVVQLRGRTDMT